VAKTGNTSTSTRKTLFVTEMSTHTPSGVAIAVVGLLRVAHLSVCRMRCRAHATNLAARSASNRTTPATICTLFSNVPSNTSFYKSYRASFKPTGGFAISYRIISIISIDIGWYIKLVNSRLLLPASPFRSGAFDGGRFQHETKSPQSAQHAQRKDTMTSLRLRMFSLSLTRLGSL
jgi:hypothetical protein